MDRPLSPVPVPTLKVSTDICVYVEVTGPNVATEYQPVACGTSLNGTRSVEDFLALLKQIINPHDFHLETLKDREVIDTDGFIGPGEYIAVGPSVTYGTIPVFTFTFETAGLGGVSPDKKRKLSTTAVAEGVRSQRDPSTEEYGFKSRLIARDKGCVVCMARKQDDDAMYMYEPDSGIFIGAHIFPLQFYRLWDKKGYSGIVTDPYSVPGASKSTTGRKNTDTRRMNSIDNGLLLCIRHHIEFDSFLFSIQPQTHVVTSFHPRTASIDGLVISQPWESGRDRTRYPPPHHALLLAHFRSSVARWMKAASEEYDEDDSLEDDEIPELAGITDNTCRIAIDLDDDVVLPQDKVGAGFTRKEHLYGGEMLTR